MAVPLTILTDPRDPAPRRTLALPPATSILRGAHAAGIDITATCGGRGRCTSCRVKFVTGTVPPPTIMDEIQLGDDQVREGYRLSCQCVPSEAVTVQVAPPLEERAFQILGAGPGVVGMGRVTLDSGIRKQVVKVGLPREEHHQTSDLEQLAAALGVMPADVGLAVLQGLPGALRDDPAGVTVTTFAAAGGERVLAVERGDTAGMKFGLAVDIGTTSVVSTLIELESGEQLGSVSSLNPQAVFGGDLMSRIAFAQFHPGNLRKLHTRIVGLLNQHIEEICRQSGVLAKWIYKVVVVGNTCMHHLLLGIDPSYVGLAPYAPVMRHPLVLPARELFLKVAPEARVCLLPLVAGFVGADEARDERQEAHARLGGDLQEELARREDERVTHHGRVGGESDVRGVDAEEEVVHARVADDHNLVDPLGQHARLAADLLDVLIEQPDDPRVELAEVARVELGEGDPRHEIAAEHRLWIEARDRPELLARLELDERADDAGGADVYGEPELHPRGVAAPDGEPPLAARRGERRDGDARGVVAQRPRQPLQHREADVRRRHAEGGRELLEVGGLVVLLTRQADLHDLLPDPRVERDATHSDDARPGTQDLKRALLEGRRDLDGHGLARHALAREPVALADLIVTELDLVHDRRGRHRAGDELDSAGGAPAPASARGGDVDACRVCPPQN